MVTVVEVVTFVVVIVNVPKVFPPAIVTLDGTLATAGLSLFRVTGSPAEHAGNETDTVAITGLPPLTVLGNDKVATGGGVTVRVAVFAERPELAVIVAAAVVHCGTLVIATCRV